MKEIYLC